MMMRRRRRRKKNTNYSFVLLGNKLPTTWSKRRDDAVPIQWQEGDVAALSALDMHALRNNALTADDFFVPVAGSH